MPAEGWAEENQRGKSGRSEGGGVSGLKPESPE